jgi:hypothetical protein
MSIAWDSVEMDDGGRWERDGLEWEETPALIPFKRVDLPSCQSTSVMRFSQQRGVSQCEESKSPCYEGRGAKVKATKAVKAQKAATRAHVPPTLLP